MTNEEYQKQTAEFALYPKQCFAEYIILGLAGEAGEVAGKLSKIIRGDYLTEEKVFKASEDIDNEMADCLWFISQWCNETGTSIGALMELNIKKLEDRKARNKIHGDGDVR